MKYLKLSIPPIKRKVQRRKSKVENVGSDVLITKFKICNCVCKRIRNQIKEEEKKGNQVLFCLPVVKYRSLFQ